MRYCRRCVLPDTRPNIRIEKDGICNACHSHETRSIIDWESRKKAFRNVTETAKAKKGCYDCVIPVSGGKDSHWQVITCLEYGLHPLAVTWKSPARTDLGRENLENLIRLGVDHIDYQINPSVEKKFLIKALERYGSTAIPQHMAIFSIPMTIALRFDIPLVVWGENSAFEYGHIEEEHTGFRLTGEWVSIYGATQGTTASDWTDTELLKRDLTPYFSPTDLELDSKNIMAVFMGYYFPWDPDATCRIASAHGFQTCVEGPRTGLYDYADIDDDFISIHHYLKWYKFGFTRLFDNLSLEIRNGRITRDKAIDIISNTGDQLPVDDISKFCSFTGIEEDRFYQIIERFRNRSIWKQERGKWHIPGFLILDWPWEKI